MHYPSWLIRLIRSISGAFTNLIVIGWVCFTLFILLWVLMTPFKTNRELFTSVWSLPSSPTLDNFLSAWSASHMGDYFLNTVIVALGATVGIVIVSTPASYVFSRIEFPGRDLLLNFFLSGMGVPGALLFIPLFLLLNSLHQSDTLQGLITVYVAFNLPFTIYLLTGFFATLPTELEESAIVDGASDWQVFYKIMLPLARPGIYTASIFNLVWCWKEFFWALVILVSGETRTLPLGLAALQASMIYSANWGALFAAVVIVMVPTLLLYIFASRRMIAGITMGAVKG
jgi:N-acetylglucosamine transport system permease protein